MSVGLYSHTTRATGTILTAAIYNSDHQNHITNQNPTMTGALSDNLSEHQSNTDPGGLGSEILAANLAEELQQLRFCIKRITGEAQWYIAPDTDLSSVGGTLTDLVVVETVAFQGDLSPAQIVANQNNYAPTGHADAFRFRLNSDAARDITGLAGGAAGRMVILANIGAQNISLLNENAASTAANRFLLSDTYILRPNFSIALQYDVTSSRWRACSNTLPNNIALAGNISAVVNIIRSGYEDIASISAPASPSAGSLRHYTKDIGAGVLRPAYKNSAGTEVIIGAGTVREYGSGSSSSLTASIPDDGSTPQNTEGTELISISLPALSNAANRVRLTFIGSWTVTATETPEKEVIMLAALFKDSDAGAIAFRRFSDIAEFIGSSFPDAITISHNASIMFEFAPGSAAAASYKVRMGPGTGFTVGRAYGGGGQFVAEEVPV